MTRVPNSDHNGQADEAAIPPVRGESFGKMMPFLEILNGDLAGRRFEIAGDPVTIGRAADNVVALDDPASSGRHCSVVRTAGTCTLRDHDSTNGTLLNGERIREAPLRPGDVLRVGSVEIAFRGDAPAGREPTRVATADSKTAPPFTARPSRKWSWVLTIIVVGVLAVAALVFFVLRLMET